MHKTHEGLQGDRLGQGEQRGSCRDPVRCARRRCRDRVPDPGRVWVSTCPEVGVDTVACGVPQRTTLAVGGPLILLVAGVWAFLRTHRVWRDRGVWWGWHGAGWFLLTLMAVTLSMSVSPIAGPVMAL